MRSNSGKVFGHLHQEPIIGAFAQLFAYTLLTLHFTRKGHFIIAEYVDKAHNKLSPNLPWAVSYAQFHINKFSTEQLF